MQTFIQGAIYWSSFKGAKRPRCCRHFRACTVLRFYLEPRACRALCPCVYSGDMCILALVVKWNGGM